LTSSPPQNERGGPAVTLALRNVTKIFPGQIALSAVDLELKEGTVHGLVGQNGSGKSTLIKIMSGFHAPEDGALAVFDGEDFQLGSQAAAERLGMRFIHQDLGLVPTLNTVDNLALGPGYTSWFVRPKAEARRARRLIEEFGFDFDVHVPVGELSPVHRTGVAIARAMHGRGEQRLRVLVLDEPTASFDSSEVEQLFDVVRHARSKGVAVLYVSHRLDEVLSVTDETTVLRDGRRVATVPTRDLDHRALVELILGRPMSAQLKQRKVARTSIRLGVEGLVGAGIRDVSLNVHRGEVVGLAGIVGSGRDVVPGAIGGLVAVDGRVLLDGEALDPLTPRNAMRRGLVYVPGDRHGKSAIPALSVRENLTLPRVPARGPIRWLGVRQERREAASWLERFDVRPAEPDRMMATLSGGNQQKVVLARALRTNPRALVIDEPAHGVDVGAKLAIFRLIRQAAESGVAVLLVSGDVDDLVEACDRVIVLREGRVGAELTGSEKTVDRVTEEALA
jgi:ribose transport system ATP-binding protein